MITGSISSLIFIVGLFLTIWLVLRSRITIWYEDEFGDINSTINILQSFLGMNPLESIGEWVRESIYSVYNTNGASIEAVTSKSIPVLAITISSIIGGISLLFNILVGYFGGLLYKRRKTEK